MKKRMKLAELYKIAMKEAPRVPPPEGEEEDDLANPVGQPPVDGVPSAEPDAIDLGTVPDDGDDVGVGFAPDAAPASEEPPAPVATDEPALPDDPTADQVDALKHHKVELFFKQLEKLKGLGQYLQNIRAGGPKEQAAAIVKFAALVGINHAEISNVLANLTRLADEE